MTCLVAAVCDEAEAEDAAGRLGILQDAAQTPRAVGQQEQQGLPLSQVGQLFNYMQAHQWALFFLLFDPEPYFSLLLDPELYFSLLLDPEPYFSLLFDPEPYFSLLFKKTALVSLLFGVSC